MSYVVHYAVECWFKYEPPLAKYVLLANKDLFDYRKIEAIKLMKYLIIWRTPNTMSNKEGNYKSIIYLEVPSHTKCINPSTLKLQI